jgi:hypothetical protein
MQFPDGSYTLSAQVHTRGQEDNPQFFYYQVNHYADGKRNITVWDYQTGVKTIEEYAADGTLVRSREQDMRTNEYTYDFQRWRNGAIEMSEILESGSKRYVYQDKTKMRE